MSDQSSEQAVRRGRLERRRPRSSSGKTRFVIAVLAFTCVGVAAAAAGSNRTQARSTGSHSAVAAAPRIVYVNNASSAGPFADPIRRGFNAACRQFHVRCTYRSTRNTTFDPREQTRLIDAAVAEKPDGLMVTDSTANVLNPHIRAAVLAGIPAIIVNSGIGQAGARTGALTYVGNDEYESGRLAGQLLSQIGAKTLLVVTVSPGLALVDQRMAGVRQGFRGAGRVIRVEIPLKLPRQPCEGPQRHHVLDRQEPGDRRSLLGWPVVQRIDVVRARQPWRARRKDPLGVDRSRAGGRRGVEAQTDGVRSRSTAVASRLSAGPVPQLLYPLRLYAARTDRPELVRP